MNLPAKKENFLIEPELYIQYQAAYPDIDIQQEFQKMKAWLLSNPQRRKTLKGMPRFINSWLSRARTEERQQGFIERHTNRAWREGL